MPPARSCSAASSPPSRRARRPQPRRSGPRAADRRRPRRRRAVKLRTVPTAAPHASGGQRQARAEGSPRRSRDAPYRYGAAGPRAFDCSGYVQYVFKKQHWNLNRTAADQYRHTKHVSHMKAPGRRPRLLLQRGRGLPRRHRRRAHDDVGGAAHRCGGAQAEDLRSAIGRSVGSPDPSPRADHARRGVGVMRRDVHDQQQRRSSSQNSAADRSPAPSGCRACSDSRSSTRRIFPEIVFGSSANSIRRIRLYGARFSRQ